MKNIQKAPFGKTLSGEAVAIYKLVNDQGTVLEISSYGATVRSLKVADKSGNLVDVVLGFDTLEPYLEASNPYFGCIIGRFGNRIAGAKFSLNGREYSLAANDGQNHLHGGIRGFNRIVWQAEPVQTAEGPAVRMSYTSPDGEEGYPGTVTIEALHILTGDNALKIVTRATTDADTILNVTQHSYFNLDGPQSGNVHDHRMTLNAEYYTPVDETAIPTGNLSPVADTPMNFQQSTKIGDHIDAECPQLKIAGGYDHNWVIRKSGGDEYALAAEVKAANSGISMQVWTTLPGIQFYSGNFLDGSLKGKNGVTYDKRQGLCLEPQFYPDTPNKPEFPSCKLQPGQTYEHTITYKFV